METARADPRKKGTNRTNIILLSYRSLAVAQQHPHNLKQERLLAILLSTLKQLQKAF
jgi:hypothetical protein